MHENDQMTGLRVIRYADTVTTRWKNGLGESRLVTRSPGDGEDFDWQISLASMSGTLPFSEYPGVDRTLFVIGGDSLRIQSPIRDTVLTSDGAGLEFDGSEKIVGTVVGSGEMNDFNVLSRQGNVRHKANRTRVSPEVIVHPVKDLTIVFVQSGSAEVRYCGATASLADGDTAIVGRIAETDICVAGDNAVCIITDIERVVFRNPL